MKEVDDVDEYLETEVSVGQKLGAQHVIVPEPKYTH
jgi:hypothetical protein